MGGFATLSDNASQRFLSPGGCAAGGNSSSCGSSLDPSAATPPWPPGMGGAGGPAGFGGGGLGPCDYSKRGV
eukprot:7139837-Pyramimonas_sp.AAC.1